jgi:PAT family acetyl-CoA transporter-like MFS transporter 1
MSKRAGKKANLKTALDASPAESPQTNGHANTSATMQNILEHRRKHSTTDPSSPSSQAASLMGQQSFSLDDPVPDHDEGTSKGFMELSQKDRRNFLLLVLLYFLQGIPMGLAMGSVPFLLKSVVSYSSIGVFSLAAYPYSLKLLWSPIVDAVWTPRLGRRKSWILPIQCVSGVSMLWLGSVVNKMMEYAGEKDSGGIWNFTFWWFALVFLCATQDIAVDGEDIFISRMYAVANSARLGSDSSLERKPCLCINSTDCWLDCGSLSFAYRLPRFQLEGLCQQMVPSRQCSTRHWHDEPG